MLNLHSICKHTITALKSHKQLANNMRESWEDIQADIAKKSDIIIINVLNNLADLYPQAPPTGATPRMK